MSSQQSAPRPEHVAGPPEWRQVLGHYPTGIAIVTSVDALDRPVGMVVGTFTSVSENPPLVGFLPQRTSKTFADIQQAGRFRVSVLGAEHESLCRGFFSSVQDRFTSDIWEYDTHGIPRLVDAVAWFDATIADVLPAGDHVMVLGAVEDLGLAPRPDAVPLVFLQGGYGTFTTPQSGFDFTDLGGRLRLANRLGDKVQRLSADLDLECVLSTVMNDEVVVLTGGEARSPYVGTSFPFAAPMDPGFAAWCCPQLRERWVENGARLGDGVDRELAEAVLGLVREHGYSISFGHTMDERFDTLMSSGPHDSEAFNDVWVSSAQAYADFCADPLPRVHASVVQLPIFGPDGFVDFELVIGGIPPGLSAERFDAVIAAGAASAREMTTTIGGRTPPDYSQPGPQPLDLL